MIRLNLLGEEPGIDKSMLMMFGGFASSIVVLVLVFAFLLSNVNSQIEEYSLEIEGFENQLVDLRKKTKIVEDLEKKRDELNSKLTVIATLKQNKLGPVRVLDDLNSALPEKAWITSIKEAGSDMKIVGYSLDNQTVTLFMKDLEQSDYFPRVELDVTKQALNKGVKVNEFTLIADVAYAGKLAVKESEEEEEPKASLAKGGVK